MKRSFPETNIVDREGWKIFLGDGNHGVAPNRLGKTAWQNGLAKRLGKTAWKVRRRMKEPFRSAPVESGRIVKETSHMKMKSIALVVFLLAVVFPFIAVAQEPVAQEEDEGEFQEAVNNLGLSAGYAVQCAKGTPAEQTIGKQAFAIADGLAKDFGTRSAFLFMIYFGVGSSESIEADQCPEYIADWKEFADKYPELGMMEGGKNE
jgi:hypothetical protein